MTVSKKYNNKELGVSLRPRRSSQLTSLYLRSHCIGRWQSLPVNTVALGRTGHIVAASLIRPLGLHSASRRTRLAMPTMTTLPIRLA